MTRFITRGLNYFKTLFFQGLFALLPITLTIALIHFSFSMVKRWLEPVLQFLPAWLLAIPHIEVVAVLAFILVFGVILRSIIVTTTIGFFEDLIAQIPLVKPVYASIKQLVRGFSAQDQGAFKNVVLVEFPRKGSYSIGFLTGPVPTEIAPNGGTKFFSIFVPATPNPTSGFYLIVAETDFTVIDISRQEAMALIISGGIILPERFKGS